MTAEQKSEIIEVYKETKSLLRTWHRVGFQGIKRKDMIDFLRESGILQGKGDNKCRFKEPELVPNDNPKYRIYTDADLDFETEIKTALYQPKEALREAKGI